jgi:hypothetical protein
MINHLLLVVVLIGQSHQEQRPFVEPLPPHADGLVVRLWIDNTRHCFYDPIFVRVTVTNTLGSEVLADTGAGRSEEYTLKTDKFVYSFNTGVPSGIAPPQRMKPGDEWIVDYCVLGFPPTDESDHDFWEDVIAAGEVPLSARFRLGERTRGTLGEVDGALYNNSRAHVRLRVTTRQEAENEFLKSLFDEVSRRRRQRKSFTLDKQKWGRPYGYPGPSAFGVNIGVYQGEDLIHRLLEFEDKLAPGTLRDVVHLTRLTRALHNETDGAKKTKIVETLVYFVDALPQIERENIVKALLDRHSAVAGDPASYLLCESLIRRLPTNIYGYEDYRAYARTNKGLDGPQFREYAERMKEIEELIEPEEERKTEPGKLLDGDNPFK